MIINNINAFAPLHYIRPDNIKFINKNYPPMFKGLCNLAKKPFHSEGRHRRMVAGDAYRSRECRIVRGSALYNSHNYIHTMIDTGDGLDIPSHIHTLHIGQLNGNWSNIYPNIRTLYLNMYNLHEYYFDVARHFPNLHNIYIDYCGTYSRLSSRRKRIPLSITLPPNMRRVFMSRNIGHVKIQKM